MFDQWLEAHQEEILASCVVFQQEQSDEELPDGVFYTVMEPVLDGLVSSLRKQNDQTRAAIRTAQYALDANISLPHFITCLDMLRRSVRGLLKSEEPTRQLAWLGQLADYLFFTSRVAATMLGSGSSAELSQQTFHQILDAVQDIVLVKGSKSQILWVNKACRDYFGIGNEDLRELTELPMSGPDNQQSIQDDAQVLSSGQLLYLPQLRMTRYDGLIRVFRVVKAPVFDSQGNVIMMVSVFHDIVDELETEAQIAAERNLMRTLIDTLPDNIYAKDLDSKFILANLAQSRFLTGNETDSLIGKSDFDFSPPEMAGQFRAEEVALMTSPDVIINAEERTLNAKGTERWVHTIKVPLRSSEGKVIGLVGISRDVTAIKQTQERERQQRQVIEAQRQTLQELSTPIIPLLDRVIIMPLIGAIDTLRATDIMRSLLAGITDYRAEVVILDITGVAVIDSGVAQHLDKTIQAARLKGARTLVTGISEAVAETVVDLGIDWSTLETARDLQTGLKLALERLGMRICMKTGQTPK